MTSLEAVVLKKKVRILHMVSVTGHIPNFGFRDVIRPRFRLHVIVPIFQSLKKYLIFQNIYCIR